MWPDGPGRSPPTCRQQVGCDPRGSWCSGAFFCLGGRAKVQKARPLRSLGFLEIKGRPCIATFIACALKRDLTRMADPNGTRMALLSLAPFAPFAPFAPLLLRHPRATATGRLQPPSRAFGTGPEVAVGRWNLSAQDAPSKRPPPIEFAGEYTLRRTAEIERVPGTQPAMAPGRCRCGGLGPGRWHKSRPDPRLCDPRLCVGSAFRKMICVSRRA